jgi:hypothetical protein
MDKESLYNEALNFMKEILKQLNFYLENIFLICEMLKLLMFLAFCEIDDEGNFDEALNCGSNFNLFP